MTDAKFVPLGRTQLPLNKKPALLKRVGHAVEQGRFNKEGLPDNSAALLVERLKR